MNRYFSRRALLTLLCLAALPLTAVAAPPKSQPTLPGEDPALSSFAKAPTTAHEAEKSGPIEAGAPQEVRFMDVASPQIEPTGELQYHIQGEFLQDQGVDLGTMRQDLNRRSEPQPLSAPPAPPGSNAVGDVSTNFDGIANTGFIPPDTVMAVGPSHIAEATNSGFAVYSKSGSTLQGYTTFSSFFNPVVPPGWSGFLFDPRLYYSVEHNKFVMLILGQDQGNLTSQFYLAVSQTSDPSGTWWLWRFDTSTGNDTDAWLDYATLGADTWGVYTAGNYFTWAGSFKYAALWSIDAAVFSGGSATGWKFWDLQWPSTSAAFSLQMSNPHSIASGEETFFVNTFSSSGTQMLLWTLTGDRDNSPSLVNATIGVAPYDAIGTNVDQPGSATDLDGGDTRIMNAYYAQRRVFTTLTTDPNNDGTASGVYVAKLNVDTATLDWDHLLWSGAGIYYFYPAIVIAGGLQDPPVSLFMSWTYPALSVYASGAVKTYTDHPNSSDGPFLGLASGLASYVSLDDDGRNRWGDYSGAGYDWFNDSNWGAIEYAGTENTWRTQIVELTGSDIFSDGFESGDTSAWSSTTSPGFGLR